MSMEMQHLSLLLLSSLLHETNSIRSLDGWLMNICAPVKQANQRTRQRRKKRQLSMCWQMYTGVCPCLADINTNNDCPDRFHLRSSHARVWERKIIESNKFSLICSFSSYLASQSKAQDWERWLETSWIFVAISTSLDTSHHDRWRDKTSADKWVFSRWIHPSIQTYIYMAPLNANTLKPSIGNDDVSVWKYIKQLTFLISLCIAFPPSPILIMVLDCVYDSLSIEWGVRTQGVGIDCLRTCLSSNQRSSKEKKDWSRWYSCLLLRKMKRQGATPLCAQ